ncbi:MAG: hypothetical protein GC182_12000 [Rhodopseudomonas sp.]|nr:hypothetical protein [Rhodopseudomonas sp.]
MQDKLKTLFARRQLRIGADQRDRLAQILGDASSVTAWDDDNGFGHGDVVIIDEPPRLLQVEGFCRSLPTTAIVVIPQSENPAFDFLKSKLHRHGMIGACAPTSPHQIWWGGPQPVRPVNNCRSILQAHLVSSVQEGTAEDETAVMLEQALAALKISHSIERHDFYVAYERKPDLRSKTLLAAWDRSEKPLLWLDPSSTGMPPALAINLSNVDFAATLTPDGTFSTNFLYFARTPVAHELLKTWNNLCQEFPTLPAGHLLDAAWSLVASQRLLVTRWLAPYRGPAVGTRNMATANAGSTLDQTPNMLDNPAQREARKAGRSAAPEPQCILNSRFGGRGPLTLTILAEFASAHDIADTMHSAVDAFFRFDGGFASLGIVICRNKAETDATLRKIGDGFFLCVRAGLVLEDRVFNTLYEQNQDRKLGYAMHRQCGHRRTSTGTDIAVTRSQVTFVNSIVANDTGRPTTRQSPALRLVSQ